ncbi:PTS sugar transporter subunit IIA [Acidithiobacillus montserratensis]|uniref:PTS sugar transporter subunit IIA n=1 Tax=Acidithiobacillus montserratensis TaxID=2729135 RepID=A0ACD5HG07_9PROT|nr:PTS sugar transporter subunit IIA [Acidithiobacillus montserratensis]MBN2679068.1 PTS sugar transporter subunit IIA [Acidithiobacillaceae bacterium]MBU2747031.1 PTS sugar transporter subunit IIA [Acidithiobacillus montserratensis]
MTTLPLGPQHILIDPPVADAGAVLEALAALLAESTGQSPALIAEALKSREAQGSTGIGHGVALPHARIDGARDVAVAALRSAQGIPFAAPDGLAVRVFIAVAVPKSAATAHLEILSNLAVRLASEEVRADLLNASESTGFFAVLTDSD